MKISCAKVILYVRVLLAFCPLCSPFFHLDKIRYRRCLQKYIERECHKNRRTEICALHIEVNGFLSVLFHTYYPIWVKFIIRYLHIMLLRSFKFCKYLPREDHTFLVAKSEISYTCALWNCVAFWKWSMLHCSVYAVLFRKKSRPKKELKS